jgi:hypothetical protein
MKMRKMLVAMAGAVLLAAGSGVSHAGAITPGSWIGFCFAGVNSPASSSGCVDPGPGTGNSFTFSLAAPAILAVTDTFLQGDVFSVLDSGSFLFTTSIVPQGSGNVTDPNIAFADPTYSSGSILLAAGDHSIDIFARISPFGGGQAYMSVGVVPIPEPEIYAMLVAGLGLMGFVARRRKQQLTAAAA